MPPSPLPPERELCALMTEEARDHALDVHITPFRGLPASTGGGMEVGRQATRCQRQHKNVVEGTNTPLQSSPLRPTETWQPQSLLVAEDSRCGSLQLQVGGCESALA